MKSGLGRSVSLSAAVPEGTTAELCLPLFEMGYLRVLLNGKDVSSDTVVDEKAGHVCVQGVTRGSHGVVDPAAGHVLLGKHVFNFEYVEHLVHENLLLQIE